MQQYRGAGYAPERLRLLGQMVRSQRELLGITRPELAKISGISVATILRIENGYQSEVKLSSVTALADTLSVEDREFRERLLGMLGDNGA